MAIGASSVLLAAVEAPPELPSGEADPGIILASCASTLASSLSAFVKAVEGHRHPVREMDPPIV